jgi:L-ascorbate metabolism protein UlaG (beta-lactamase superfamily)
VTRAPDDARITYIGHATLLIEIAGLRILTDPNFDARLAGVLRRVRAPGVALHELPPLDAVLITHAHADHLSLASLAGLTRGAARAPIFAPQPVARWLRAKGHHATPVTAGTTISMRDVRIAAGPAAHAGTRYGIDWWRRAAVTYLIESPSSSVFFAGDTGLVPDSHELTRTLLEPQRRRLDVALLPIGHAPWWKPRFRRGHLSSADALVLFERLGARYMIPYHWGTFHHLTSGPYDAMSALRDLLADHPRRSDVRVIEPGDTFDLNAAAVGTTPGALCPSPHASRHRGR